MSCFPCPCTDTLVLRPYSIMASTTIVQARKPNLMAFARGP